MTLVENYAGCRIRDVVEVRPSKIIAGGEMGA